MHHTKEKGDYGVLKVQCEYSKNGYIVMNPMTEHSPFDFVAYKNGIFQRVQVKYRTMVNGKITLPFRTSWNDRNGSHSRYYNFNEVDVFAIYCPNTDKCYFLKSEDVKGKKCIDLRILPAKNHQKENIIMAENYVNIP